MFDPHHIGPRYESRYSRNKGRVFQRKVVNEPPSFTRSQLEKLVPVMIQNGIINGTTPDPSPDPDPFYIPLPVDSIHITYYQGKHYYLNFKDFQSTAYPITLQFDPPASVDEDYTLWICYFIVGRDTYHLYFYQKDIVNRYEFTIPGGAVYGYTKIPGHNLTPFYGYLHGLHMDYIGMKLDWYYIEDKQYMHELEIPNKVFNIVWGSG